jgi:hypothetical protein
VYVSVGVVEIVTALIGAAALSWPFGGISFFFFSFFSFGGLSACL